MDATGEAMYQYNQLLYEAPTAVLSVGRRPLTYAEYTCESTLADERYHARLQPGVDLLAGRVIDTTADCHNLTIFSSSHAPLRVTWQRYFQNCEFLKNACCTCTALLSSI